MKYEKLTMRDVAYLCGFPQPNSGRGNINISCPKCDSKRRHLNVDFVHNVFRCPKCGFSGGIFDLYSALTGVSRDDARVDMYNRLNGSEAPALPKWTPPPEGKPLASIEKRHTVYTELLQCLPLAKDHRENLNNRGLTDAAIAWNQYKTAPTYGYTKIAKALIDKLGQDALSGVPGFYRTETDEWTLETLERGILIPVRDIQGRIQGLQVRLDKVDKRKYRWVSSRQRRDGSATKAFCHLSGSVVPEIMLTEGPLKADVVRALTGRTVLAVPGVNALSALEPVLLELKQLGMQKIMTAYDMDMLENPHVREANNKLGELLAKHQIHFGMYYWDAAYKGIDDYVWHLMQEKH